MRDFSAAIKYSVVRENLEKNNGRICCEICGKELKSINDGHFDHIKAYARGGKSTKENCQILCSNCNLKKNDKELNDFLLDEKARKFLEGISIDEVQENEEFIEENPQILHNKSDDMTKEKFDLTIGLFIKNKGNITKTDFSREYNNLPSYYYVNKYYGDLNKLKKEFNIKEKPIWNRETIKEALKRYIEINGDVFEKDLKAKNDLPSYPCIIKYFPEYKGLNELKVNMFNLKVRKQWTKEDAIEAGKKFVKKNKKITLKDLNSKNNLPDAKVIYRNFGTLQEFQRIVGSEVSYKNELITVENIDDAVESTLSKDSREFESTKELFDILPISQSVIYRNFGSIEKFCKKYNIIIKNKKKAKFSKKEIDDIILQYLKEGKQVPSSAKDLVSHGLPSRDSIMRYYRDWHEPFVLYSKLIEKIN